jgi:FkbM family methyltransferase
MNLNLHDYMDHALFFDFNDQSRESLFASAEGAETIVDVGANNGYTALRLASLDGVNRVIAFEPDATNFEKAKRNIALNGVTEKIELLGIGVGPGDLELNLKIGIEGNSGTMKVTASIEGGATASRVKVRKLDDVLAESGIARVDFIKIDVEGYEFEVLKGAVETLRSSRPRLFIEIDDSNLSEQSTSARDLIGFLMGLGYSCTNTVTGEALSVEYDFKGKHFDAICVPAAN